MDYLEEGRCAMHSDIQYSANPPACLQSQGFAPEIHASGTDSQQLHFDSYDEYFEKRIFPIILILARVGILLILAFAALDVHFKGGATIFIELVGIRLIAAVLAFGVIVVIRHPTFSGKRSTWIVLLMVAGMLVLCLGYSLVDPRPPVLPLVITYYLLAFIILAPLVKITLLSILYMASMLLIGASLFISNIPEQQILLFSLFVLPTFIFLSVALVAWQRSGRETYALARQNFFYATFDMLSGVLNRRSWYEQLESTIGSLQDGGGELSLIILDIDHFKAVNDRWGHLAGDEVIRTLSARILQCTQGPDTPGSAVGRLGGEEFGIMIPGVDHGYGMEIAERIRREIASKPVPWGKGLIRVTVSLGVATGSAQLSLDHLVARADRALYVAKHGGRNRSVPG